MQYKTELHAHTAQVSPCAVMTAEQVVDEYIAAGYTTLLIADHFCDYVMDNGGVTWKQKVDHYLAGYRRAKEYAGDRINVLLGCELRFVGSMNDYLIFGMTEEFLYDHPELHKMQLKRFRPFAVENNMLIVQAHPFRNAMEIMAPKFLDGMEVFNSTPNPPHDNRDDVANLWAMRYGLIRTSGSDFHGGSYKINGGILTDEPVTSIEQLVEILRAQSHTLICNGPSAEKQGFPATMPAKY